MKRLLTLLLISLSSLPVQASSFTNNHPYVVGTVLGLTSLTAGAISISTGTLARAGIEASSAKGHVKNDSLVGIELGARAFVGTISVACGAVSVLTGAISAITGYLAFDAMRSGH